MQFLCSEKQKQNLFITSNDKERTLQNLSASYISILLEIYSLQD